MTIIGMILSVFQELSNCSTEFEGCFHFLTGDFQIVQFRLSIFAFFFAFLFMFVSSGYRL